MEKKFYSLSLQVVQQRKDSVHMVNLVKVQSIVQYASENGWRHLRLGLYKVWGTHRKNFQLLGTKPKAPSSSQLLEISELMLITQASRFSYAHTDMLLCPREIKGKDFAQMFLTSCGVEVTLWSHYRKSRRSVMPYTPWSR